MKCARTLAFFLVVSAFGFAIAQADATGDKGIQNAGMVVPPQTTESKTPIHRATAMVKDVYPLEGRVKLAHGPVKSLNWSPMTTSFTVKDKTLLGKLGMRRDVVVDFVQEGTEYVIIAVM